MKMKRKIAISIVIASTFALVIATPNKQTCTTAGCNETSKILLNNINFNVDPCNNFYEFACGNFIKNTKIPKDRNNVQTIRLLADKIDQQVMDIISEPIQQDDIQPFILAKQLYKACMNEDIIEQRGLTPLKNILNKLGGWPVLEKNNWNDTKFSWHKTLIEVEKLGFTPGFLFYVNIDTDTKNKTNHILTIDKVYLSLDREYVVQGIENEVVQAYFNYMKNVAKAMGADEKTAAEELKESFNFEMKLANITLPSEERQNVSNFYNPTSIKQLQITYPSIPWLNYIKNMLYSTINVTEDEIVINAAPEFIKQLEILLKTTPKRTIANYIMWKIIQQILPHLSKDYRKFSDDFVSVMTGVKVVQLPRDKQCIEIVHGQMSVAIGALYVRKFFKNESKNQMNQLVNNMQLEFKYLLENVDWMDNKTKQNALKKIAAIYAHVAYPEELMDDNKIIDYYKNLKFNESMYLESLLNLSIFLNVKYFEEFRIPYNKTKWTAHSYAAFEYAYYSVLQNSIELPAGLLQGEFFTSDRPKYMNYGSIGSVIGYELTLGFGDFSRESNKDGNAVDWWEPSTSEAFVKKAECNINQYRNYSVGKSLHGENNHNEYIADNGGAKCAYRAYKRWAKAHDPEPALPGMSFTPEQMFWISMATIKCSKYRSDEISPSEFRVNGVVSNQEEFAKDFGCSKGAPMNPEIKCKVW